MKIEKLPSGSFRVRQQYKGKRHSIIFDHKPTVREINTRLAEEMAIQSQKMAQEDTLKAYADKYLDKCRKDGKSPSTVKGYKSKYTTSPAWFQELNINSVTEELLNKAVEEYAGTHSPKSTRDMHSLWHSILAEYRPNFTYSIKLPTVTKKKEYEPSTKDIKAILEYAKGSRYYMVLKLASIGLRRGEACCVFAEDINSDNVLTINKAMIVDENNKQVIKDSPKTDASNRRILIPGDLADMIRTNGQAFEGNMHTINEYLHKAQDALNIPRFRLHIMRHFAAAYLLKNGFNTVQIEDYMGWEHGSSVMQKVYAYNLDPEDSQKDIASAFADLS